MLYVYPDGTTGEVIRAYEAPYGDPIVVRAGDPVVIDQERTASTDVIGWLWCVGPDGRAGWTPEAWIDRLGEHACMRRDFDAVELSVEVGDRVRLRYAESGFVWCCDEGRQGWLPDGVLALTLPGPDTSSEGSTDA